MTEIHGRLMPERIWLEADEHSGETSWTVEPQTDDPDFQQVEYVRADLTRALSPSLDLEEALFAIADGEGDAQTIARQTLEANGLGVPCEDEGCPQHGTRHLCFNPAALATPNAQEGEGADKQRPIDGFILMHFEQCDYFTSRGTKPCTMDCCS